MVQEQALVMKKRALVMQEQTLAVTGWALMKQEQALVMKTQTLVIKEQVFYRRKVTCTESCSATDWWMAFTDVSKARAAVLRQRLTKAIYTFIHQHMMWCSKQLQFSIILT